MTIILIIDFPTISEKLVSMEVYNSNNNNEYKKSISEKLVSMEVFKRFRVECENFIIFQKN